jgi:hypothetical protein
MCNALRVDLELSRYGLRAMRQRDVLIAGLERFIKLLEVEEA